MASSQVGNAPPACSKEHHDSDDKHSWQLNEKSTMAVHPGYTMSYSKLYNGLGPACYNVLAVVAYLAPLPNGMMQPGQL